MCPQRSGMTRAQKMTKDLLAILRFLPSQRQDTRLANNFLRSQVSDNGRGSNIILILNNAIHINIDEMYL